MSNTATESTTRSLRMEDYTCSVKHCALFARFKVFSLSTGKPSGGHQSCGRHLTRLVEYVTVPGSSAHVEHLER